MKDDLPDPFPIDDADFADAVEEMGKSLPGYGRTGKKRESQADRLVALAACAELFCSTSDGAAFATIPVEDHRETHAIRSTYFRRWLSHQFHLDMEKAPGAQAMSDALLVLEGRAAYKGPLLPVYNRVAEHDGKFYVDLGSPYWEAVEISPEGWRIIQDVPVKFRRPRGMAALPYPILGGKIEDLRPFVNIATDADWILLVSWIMAAFRPQGPYPLLVVVGEQGRGKTMIVKYVRGVIDPACPSVRAEPRNAHDLAIAANSNWVIALDNMSHIVPWLSDCLCRLSTGGGFATRELYTDGEEMLFDAKRPSILNGIEEIATRGDLLDRSLHIEVAYLPESRRRTEKELDEDFQAALPKILGAFLTVVSGALRDLPNTKLTKLPRMADFALWIAAAEPSLGWAPGTFDQAYGGNRADQHHLALESSAVGGKVREFVALEGGDWEGTMGDLLTGLNDLFPKSASGKPITPEKWPKTPKGLSGSLRRVAPHLRAVGVDVADGRREAGTGRRLVTIRTMPEEPPATPARAEWETL